MSVIYRKLEKSDHGAIKGLINESFGLYRYVHSKTVLKSWLNVYLNSCLAEKTFDCVAEKDGEVVGVIMGNAKSDYKTSEHIKPIAAMAYHGASMYLKAMFTSCDLSTNGRMHRIYDALTANSGESFDGVLTLFAVTEGCRGLGVGKSLLGWLLDYQREQNTNNMYLYTDSGCNYGFYDSQGFTQLGEDTMMVRRDHVEVPLNIYLYAYKADGAAYEQPNVD